ncbi:conjugal transfer protein [Taylorella equigenitalis]|uniref:VirB4 family type IV secretion/conjugal transfer ATPase n=1 Tax=Taylorella equigenitalis TaxID=29575 RepID=UPI000F6FD6FA|nr:conjugal transfer protein [Taylorella equigenitalis]VEG31917.1 Type IV secretion system protein virB4 [Taylorella equigenitalis ATCC 35865]
MPKISHHVTPELISYEDGYLAWVIQVDGMPFESQNNSHIITHFEQLNNLLTAIGKTTGNRLALWTTLQRKKRQFEREYSVDNLFTNEFLSKYVEKFKESSYFSNYFYITGVLKIDDIDEGIKEANELIALMLNGLQAYTPTLLKAYTEEDVMFSEIWEFFATLINYKHEQIPETHISQKNVIGNTDLHFGTDVCQLRTQSETLYCVSFDLKDFGISKPKILVDILNLPFEFTLTQSFVFVNSAEMQGVIDKQLNNLVSAGDLAIHQQEELLYGKGFLSAGELMFGEYHSCLVVYGESPSVASQNGSKAVSRFLNAGGFRFTKAGLSAPATYFSQIPKSPLRPRKYPKTTQNLATTFGMHNYSAGKEIGNPIGDGTAIMPLKTVSNTIYDFNFHYSNVNEDNLGDKIAGHTLILGATGTGKTTLETSLLTFTNRFNPYLFVMDLDEGMKIFLSALGGTYFTFEEGKPTGLNPFQIEDTPANREFLYTLVGVCGRNVDGTVTADEEGQIKLAVDTLFNIIDFENRNFSTLLQSIPYQNENPNSLRTRLSKWCRSTDGRFSWCLDNETNIFNHHEFTKIGFDLTDILQDKYPPTEPVLLYLFYLRSLMMERVAKEDGILCTVIEEFWYPLRFSTTSELILKMLKTDRKLGGWCVLTSQSPEDAITSDIFPAIVQQTPTKVFLPNPDAVYEGRYEFVGITRKEFDELVKLSLDSRTFLVKQSKQSAFAKLDLYGFSDEMAVLSGNSANNELLDEIIKRVDSKNPDVWYPIFKETINERRKAKKLI